MTGGHVPVRVAMMACDREGAYVAESLRGIFAAEPSLRQVDIVIDGADAAFLGRWATDKRVVLHLLDDLPRDDEGTEWRTVRTFRRCLELHQSKQDAAHPAWRGHHLVVVQDDVEFAPGWLTKTRAGLSWCENNAPNAAPWVLQVYTPFGLHDLPVHQLDVDLYYANVGLAIPCGIVGSLMEHVGAPGVPRADDMAVAHYLKVKGGAYLALNPSVVQHTGDVSAQVGREEEDFGPRRSPTFGPLPSRPSFRVYGLTKGHGSSNGAASFLPTTTSTVTPPRGPPTLAVS